MGGDIGRGAAKARSDGESITIRGHHNRSAARPETARIMGEDGPVSEWKSDAASPRRASPTPAVRADPRSPAAARGLGSIGLVWTLAMALLAAPVADAAAATGVPDSPFGLSLAQAGAPIGPDQAAGIVRSALGGRVLSVHTTSRRGRPVYLVKILLAGGRVRVILVDAESGQMYE